MLTGLLVLGVLHRFATQTFASLRDIVGWTFLFLAAIWWGGGLFMTGDELYRWGDHYFVTS